MLPADQANNARNYSAAAIQIIALLMGQLCELRLESNLASLPEFRLAELSQGLWDNREVQPEAS